jgi:hypothetical protein
MCRLLALISNCCCLCFNFQLYVTDCANMMKEINLWRSEYIAHKTKLNHLISMISDKNN